MDNLKPACDGEYEIFDAVIDHPNRFNVHDAAGFCVRCPLVATCLPTNIAAGGEDAAWATVITREIAVRKKREAAA